MYFLAAYRRGIFNRYRKGMPAIEMTLKDLNHGFNALMNYIKNGFQHKTLVVHPHYPSRGSTLYKAARSLNLNITNNITSNCVGAVFWEYLTFREEYHALEKLPSSIEVVNLYSRDISKVFVDEAFHQVFGYSTIIDPKTYFGKIVQKSDVNAAHDGAILEGPIQDTKEGSIYQVLIDNSYGENLVLDIRVPVVGKTLDFVYLKYRDISERFKNTTVKTEKKPIREVLSDEEIDLLDQFAETIELDFGEFDVLRDNDSKKIYVVDVNNTPQGPPASTPKQDGKEAILTIAHQLESAYLSA